MSLDGEDIVRWLARAAEVFEENKVCLTDLDAAIGDSDHGVNMARGFMAVRDKLPTAPRDDLGAMLKSVGMTLLSTVGGASGPLYGTFFLDAAKAAGKTASLDLAAVGACFRAGLEGVVRRGKAVAGDKTMVDALEPAIAALEADAGAGATLEAALVRAAETAKEKAESTKPLQARKGRASYLGERSVGHQDPGATSTWLLLQCLAATKAGA